MSFVAAALGFEVLQTGRYSGCLIVLKPIPQSMPPQNVARYWLLDAQGKDVAEIGADESSVRQLKDHWN